MSLNKAQKEAVSHKEGPCLVLAGPGSGKTLTIAKRIEYLIKVYKVRPEEILVITFTKYAAGEMRDRFQYVMEGRRLPVTFGTFHGIFYGILKWAYKLDRSNILSEEEKNQLLKEILKQMDWEQTEKSQEADFLQELSEEIGNVGNNAVDIEFYESRRFPKDKFRELYRIYETEKKKYRKLDFEDMLIWCRKLFLERPDLLAKWQEKYHYVLVDEFQDIDRLQLRLLRAWRREGGTFFAIGDPDQSIYGFRGADAGCFSALGAERTVRLTENYRSTPEILAAALPVAEAIDGAPRRMETHSPHGAEVRLLTDEGDRAEAIFVAKEIARMVGGIGMLEAQALGAARGARSFGDIAVLYRTRRQAALLEECLAHDGIPCVVTGREDFLLDGEVQDALAWLERQQEEGKSPAALLEEWTAHHTPSGGVERLRNMAVFFGDVTAFLRNLTIGQEGDLLRRAGLSYAAGAVTLSTLHGAKGLEWPVVFLCGVGEGRIPLERKGLDTDEAEERRLLYVGMTRAREELVLLSGGEPSRFLAGLPLRQDTAHAPVPRPLGVQLSLFK